MNNNKTDIENIDSKDIIAIYQNDIDYYINLFCEENNIQDLCSISQNRFNALLYYLYLQVFKDIDLRTKDRVSNKYDLDKIENLSNYFIYLCDKYDKIASFQAFCKLTGVDSSVLYDWAAGDWASVKASQIVKKLNAERERTLADRLASGKSNPVGVLGCLNHWHGWSGVGNMAEDREKQAATLADVRKSAGLLSDNLSGSGGSGAENIQDKLSDNLTQ